MKTQGFGRVVQDLELRYIGDAKTAVLDFTLAIDSKVKTKSGDVQKKTDFLDFQAWSSGAETIAKWVKKGDLLYVSASPRKDVWEAEDGSKRSKVYFRVDEFNFIPTGRKNSESAESDTQTPPVDDNSAF